MKAPWNKVVDSVFFSPAKAFYLARNGKGLSSEVCATLYDVMIVPQESFGGYVAEECFPDSWEG